MGEDLVVNVKYTEADFVRGMSYAHRRSGSVLVNTLFIVSGLAAYSFIYLYLLHFDEDWNIGFIIQFTLIGLVLGGVLYAIRDFAPLTESRFSKFYDASPLLKEEFRIEIGPAGFASTSPSFSNLVKWQGVTETAETSDDFYFFLGPEQPLFIPKRVFTRDQMDVLRLITQTFGPRPAP